MPRIVVTNAVLSNTGDAAIYESIAATLLETHPDVSIAVFDSDAKATRKLYPAWEIFQQASVSPPRRSGRLRNLLQRVRDIVLSAVLRRRALLSRLLALPLLRQSNFSRSLRALQEADVVISSGGTYLVDHYNFSARVREAELVRLFDKPLVLWTQSMGPFESERSQRQINAIGAIAHAVSFRDARSEAAWRARVHSEARTRIAPDSVFALRGRTRTAAAKPSRALISVREWNRGVASAALDRAPYEQAMQVAAEMLVARGWNVEALSTCQGVSRYRYDDSEVARVIFSGLDVRINREFHTPSELLEELNSAGLVVTTRMHLAILSMLARVPVIAIAYEFKTIELFRALGFGDLVVSIEDISPEWLTARIETVMATPDRATLTEEKLSVLRAAAMAPADDLGELLSRR